MQYHKILSAVILSAAIMVPFGAEAKKKVKITSVPAKTVSWAKTDDQLRAELAETPEKSGGIFYAYPYLNTPDSMAAVPAGFEPVYISHYGRHGSRWHTNKEIYNGAFSTLQKQQKEGNLTPQGEEVLKLVEICKENAAGHEGELTGLGSRQHKAIANRMYHRFPTLFKSGDTIMARCSLEPRCIISMSAFSEALKENDPKLVIDRHSTPSDQSFIRYHSPEAKKLNAGPEPWKSAYQHVCDSLYECKATAAKLFKDPSKVKKLPDFMYRLHNIAVVNQNIDNLNVNLFPYFDKEDIYNLWKGQDHKLYFRHGKCIDSEGKGPESSRSLLKDILDRADEGLAGKRTAVDLRFGHDVYLLRLLALMDAEGANASTRGVDNSSRVWQSQNLTPMAANIQFIFFRNNGGETIATIRLNERPIKLDGLTEYAPGYYSWPALRKFLTAKL